MHVTLLFNQISNTPTAEELDVLLQCDAVEAALSRLGHRVSRIPFVLDLSQVQQALRAGHPDVVFNLVESVDSTDRLMPLATLLVESMGLPFTGTGSYGIISTSGKLIAKQKLLNSGLPTPAWISESTGRWQGSCPDRAIIKTVWEHASFGIDESSVVDCFTQLSGQPPVARDAWLIEQLRIRERSTRKEHFAEQYIHGREFNVTLIAGSAGVQAMPPAEILFIDYPPDKPHIVDYRAKWTEDSLEYQNTPRSFQFSPEELPLIDQMKQMAVFCWNRFRLRGWARVDFRVDKAGRPWILEINANPCLAPDAGFAAAILKGGLAYEEAINLILKDAFHNR